MKIRIFAIFKNMIYASALEPFLRSNGMEVVDTCTNIDLAMEQYKRLEVDLILMDYNWHEGVRSVSADSLINQLTKSNPNIKIIAVTSFFDSWVVAKLKEHGVQGYFFKYMDDILEQVKLCIESVNRGEIYYATKEGNTQVVTSI